MLYLDASAVLKLLFDQEESDALESFLIQEGGDNLQVNSSELVLAEVERAIQRTVSNKLVQRASVYEQWQMLCRKIALVKVTTGLIIEAGRLDTPHLGTLDALHIVSARTLLSAGLRAFITYDRQQLKAAADLGLNAVSP